MRTTLQLGTFQPGENSTTPPSAPPAPKRIDFIAPRQKHADPIAPSDAAAKRNKVNIAPLVMLLTAAAATLLLTASRQGSGHTLSKASPATYPLHLAAKSGKISDLKTALRSSSTAPDPIDAQKVTPLMLASLGGHQDAVEALLSAKAQINARDHGGFSALSYAIGSGHHEIAHTLLAAGASPDADAHPGEPVAVHAARAGDLSLVTALTKTEAGRSSLDLVLATATNHRHTAIANLALDLGAGVVPFTGGKNALDEAVLSGQHATALRILEIYGPELPSLASPDLLFHATAAKNYPLISALLESGFDPDISGASGETALHLAITTTDDTAARLLLEGGAIPGPLLAHALAQGNATATDLLLEYGADPNAHLPDNEPPLFVAMRSGNHDLATRLMTLGADVSLPGREGQGALATAIAMGDLSYARILLEAGADPDTQLHAPATSEYTALITEGRALRSLLKKDSRFTPLMVAAGSGQADAIRLLRKHGAKLNRTTKSWRRWPVNFAAGHGSIECQQLLLGYDPETIPKEKQNHIIIDLSDQKAIFYRGNKVIRTSSVSTGKKGHRTRTGTFVISNKYRQWTSTLYNSSMPYFQRLSCSDFGLHVGHVPGYPASHGCIRMPAKNAQRFYASTRVGDRVTIRP